MAEIDNPVAAHQEIHRFAQSLGVELIAVDTDMYGPPAVTLQQAVAIAQREGKNDALLVKGSRVAGLERLVAAIVGEER